MIDEVLLQEKTNEGSYLCPRGNVNWLENNEFLEENAVIFFFLKSVNIWLLLLS